MKKNILTAVLMASALTFTSCLNSDGDNQQKTTINYGNNMCFNVVTDLNDPESTFISTAPNYITEINFTDAAGVISMSNIKLTPEGSNLTFKLPALPLTVNNTEYSYNLNGTLITPEGQADQLVFNKVGFSIIERNIQISGQWLYAPVYKMGFTVNGDYEITAFPTAYYFPGDKITSTLLTPGEDDEPYTDENAVVSIILSTDKTDSQNLTATLTLYDVKLNSTMSAVTFRAENLPVSYDRAGFTIHTDENTAYGLKDAAGIMKDCKISNINIRTSVPSGVSTMSFDVDLSALNPQRPIKPVNVTADRLTYHYPQNSNK